MEEKTFLSEHGVTVTNVRFIVPKQTYAMSGITSVKEYEERPSIWLPILLIVLGLALLTGEGNMPTLGVVTALVSGAWLYQQIARRQHHVVLSTSGGETTALSSKDREWVSRVVKALNESIVARG